MVTACLVLMCFRYDPCILWLDLRDRGALEKRLRTRVKKMCQVGIVFHSKGTRFWKCNFLNFTVAAAGTQGRGFVFSPHEPIWRCSTPLRSVLQEGLLEEVEWLVDLLHLRHNFVSETWNGVSIEVSAKGNFRTENIKSSEPDLDQSLSMDSQCKSYCASASEPQRQLGVLQGIGTSCNFYFACK